MGMTLHATSTMLHKHDTAHGASTQYGSIKNSLVVLPKSLSQQVMQLGETTLNGRRYMVPDAELLSTLFAPLRSPVSILDLYPQ